MVEKMGVNIRFVIMTSLSALMTSYLSGEQNIEIECKEDFGNDVRFPFSFKLFESIFSNQFMIGYAERNES